MSKQHDFEKLPDGSIHIKGIPWELHINYDGIIYDADKHEVGELTECGTAAIIYDDDDAM